MHRRAVLAACLSLLIATACGGQSPVAPTPAATPPPTAAIVDGIPSGPILFEPQQLILPPEEFPLSGFEVALDTPRPERSWERQFMSAASRDFKWFTVRLFLLEPDMPSSAFIADHGCDAIKWEGETPSWKELAPRPSGDGSRACRYDFADGLRVLYHTTGFRNLGIVVGMQPRRAEVTDEIALEWLASLAKQQIGIVGRVLKSAQNGTGGG